MQCSKCGLEVPADAIYCSHCTGDRKATDAAVINGGVKGGAIGLAIGLALVTVLLANYELERGITAIALALPIGTFATGLIIGLVRAKREWK